MPARGEARAPGPTLHEQLLDDPTPPDAPLLVEAPVFLGDEDLPYEAYNSPTYAQAEYDHLWGKCWQWACHVDHIPEPGDYIVYDLGPYSALIARTEEREIVAYYNACMHRGTQLRPPDSCGFAGQLKCPFHGWTWSLNGDLIEVPSQWDFPHVSAESHRLPKMPVGVWEGFVFVNFDEEAKQLAPTLSRYAPYLEHYDLENSICPGTFTLEGLSWNWKVMFENFNDGYHANRLHKYVQDFCPSDKSAFPVPWDDASNVIFREAGYVHIDAGFNPTHKALLPVYPQLTEEERWRSTFALIPPTLCVGTAPDQAFFFIVRPITAGTIDIEVGYLFHPTAVDHPLFDQLLEASDAGVQVFIRQDQDATTKVQAGLSSRFAPRGRYSWQEESHVQFNRWLFGRYSRWWPKS